MSLPWVIVKRHADQRVEHLRNALESAPADRIAAIQGEVKAWREIASLPENLRDTDDKHLEPDSSGYA